MSETPAGLALLRRPFPEHQISQLPKPYKADSPKGSCRECGGYHGLPAMHLDYVGHAALTDRLLDADPGWSWEPVAFGSDGLPLMDRQGGLWIRLTVCGVTRLGYGDAQGKTGPNAVKEAIGDALRNAAMRFGAALDLWHKGDLHAAKNDDGTAAAAAAGEDVRPPGESAQSRRSPASAPQSVLTPDEKGSLRAEIVRLCRDRFGMVHTGEDGQTPQTDVERIAREFGAWAAATGHGPTSIPEASAALLTAYRDHLYERLEQQAAGAA